MLQKCHFHQVNSSMGRTMRVPSIRVWAQTSAVRKLKKSEISHSVRIYIPFSRGKGENFIKTGGVIWLVFQVKNSRRIKFLRQRHPGTKAMRRFRVTLKFQNWRASTAVTMEN